MQSHTIEKSNYGVSANVGEVPARDGSRVIQVSAVLQCDLDEHGNRVLSDRRIAKELANAAKRVLQICRTLPAFFQRPPGLNFEAPLPDF